MGNTYWSDWYTGWGWFLWFGLMILLFSSFGNWGYTYRLHQNYGRPPQKGALDILSERYARSEITHDEFRQMKTAITTS